MDNRPPSSNLRSANKRLRIGIWPGSSGLASTASPTMDVLRNLDLLELILSYLAEKHLSKDGQQRLLLAGLTCKAFFEPAMNLLWSEMDSLLPLLLVIPLVMEEEEIYTSTSIIKETDLYRFEFYASRIKMLQLQSFMENVSTHIYMAIAAIFQGKTLFPALRHVHILSLDDISNENFLFLHLITPSPLSTVKICDLTKSNGIRLTSFIHDMSRLHRSGSTNLHPLSAFSLEGRFLPSTANLLQNFIRLTKFTFELTVTTRNILKEILKISSSLPSLLQFKLELPEDESEKLRTNLPRESKSYTFPALQNLDVVGPARHVCDILRCTYGVCLSRITFTILPYAHETHDDIPKCIRRCTTMTPTLLHLHINLPPHSIRMEEDMFAPFRDYRLLRSLHINSHVLLRPHIVDLFDEEFGEWPVLETAIFELNDGHLEFKDDTHPTAPIHLPAISCPKLRKLEIYLSNPFNENVQIANDTMRDLLDSSERTDHILTELKITFVEPDYLLGEKPPAKAIFMEAKEAILLARVIDHLYPNLKCLDIYGDIELQPVYMESSFWRPWYRGIEMMVKNFREVRDGCRANIHST